MLPFSSKSNSSKHTDKPKKMLQIRSSQLERVVERQSRRLQLTESLQDYFALNPRIYKRHTGAELPDDWFVPDDSETEQTQTSTTASTLSLDGTNHVRRARSSSQSNKSSSSLDVTVHRERRVSDKASDTTAPLETQPVPPRTGRRVRWLMDFDPSDGSIE